MEREKKRKQQQHQNEMSYGTWIEYLYVCER